MVFASPRVISLLDIERGLIGAMNRTGRKGIYDNLINIIEKHHRAELLVGFRRITNFVTIGEREFKADGQIVSPDFLIWEPRTDRVLVADYKHALDPLGPVEVKSKMSEMSGWLAKLTAYVTFFERYQHVLSSAFPERMTRSKVAAVEGMILTRWPLPLPIGDDGKFPIADSDAFAQLLQLNPDLSLDGLFEWARRRPDVDRPQATRLVEQVIQVGDWKYLRQTLTTEKSRWVAQVPCNLEPARGFCCNGSSRPRVRGHRGDLRDCPIHDAF
jgi:hypothetical protein